MCDQNQERSFCPESGMLTEISFSGDVSASVLSMFFASCALLEVTLVLNARRLV